MKNLYNIDDKVKVIKPELDPKGIVVEIESMQKWSDGVVHYGGKYNEKGTDGRPYNRGVQFTEDQCSLVETKPESKEKLKADSKIEPIKKSKENLKDTIEQK